ncbi:MAG TPA: threonine synthase [Anaerolineae bacterium]|nr:threonine synthase [Anaerolineae bacterium]
MSNSNSFVCTSCGKSYPLDTRNWRCECGGLFDLERWPAFDPGVIDATQPGLWRYWRLLPIEPGWEPVTLGEGNTPLLPLDWQGQDIYFKLESISPTGSFKDRGASLLVTSLRGLGIERTVEDSSGNAGASLAAYGARAGIACEICVPDTAGGPKLAQMAAHGAEVIQIKGKREYAALAAWAAAAHGAFYASHVFNPYFMAGLETVAYELWEQLGHRAPKALVLPVGNGTLLVGAYRGFRRLQRAGLIDRMPRLFAVQAAACAPIYNAYHADREAIEPVVPCSTAANAIAISQPARGAQVLSAVRATRGDVIAVAEEAIPVTRNQLAHQGFYLEDTSAVAVAALADVPTLQEDTTGKPVVVFLTGHGLKTYVAE